MTKRLIGILFLLFSVTLPHSFAQTEEKTLSLSLDDCILKALQNNLGVAIEVLSPEISDYAIALAREKYLPTLTLDYTRRNTNQASYSFLEGGGDVTTSRNDYSLRFNQLIPTGGNVSVSLTGLVSDTSQKFQTINPRYSNTLTFSFTQPLLKNFGLKLNRREIIVARNNSEISDNNLKRALHNTVYQVEEAYWNLIYTTELLKVRKQSLKLAQDLLEKNKKSVEVGTLAPIEILNAESTVATREADILQAEATVKNAEDLLKTILNLTPEEAESTKVIPTDTPKYDKVDVTLPDALVTAMKNRPDLETARIDVKNRKVTLDYQKNQLLPDLSLQASYWSPGVSGTQIIYDPNDPFGPPIGEIPGGAGQALRDVFGFKYQNWSVGLSLDIPINAIFARAAFAQAKVNLEQTLLRLQSQEQDIYLEIKTEVRAVQTNYKRVQAYKIARELQEKNLEAEEEKFKVGLTTNYFVLQYQRDLAEAQVAELSAVIDYNLSLANLSRALGTTLKEKNISLADFYGR